MTPKRRSTTTPRVERPRLCGATAPSAHVQACDKAHGHPGDHRGYVSTVDVVEFWPNADEPVSVDEALAMRRTRDEDEE